MKHPWRYNETPEAREARKREESQRREIAGDTAARMRRSRSGINRFSGRR